MKNPEKYKNILADSDFVKSYIFPSAEAQTVLRWLSNVIKGKAKEVDEMRVVMLPTKTEASELTAHAGVVCLNHLKPLYGKIKLHCSRDSSGIIPLQIKVDTREEILQYQICSGNLMNLSAPENPAKKLLYARQEAIRLYPALLWCMLRFIHCPASIRSRRHQMPMN